MKTFENINLIVNCNSIKMTNGTKWIELYLKQSKTFPQKNLNKMLWILQDFC